MKIAHAGSGFSVLGGKAGRPTNSQSPGSFIRVSSLAASSHLFVNIGTRLLGFFANMFFIHPPAGIPASRPAWTPAANSIDFPNDFVEIPNFAGVRVCFWEKPLPIVYCIVVHDVTDHYVHYT